MTKPSKKLETLIQAGQILSNIAFNLSQSSADKKDKNLFAESYKRWDDALKSFKN